MWNVSALKSNGLYFRIVSVCWHTCFVQSFWKFEFFAFWILLVSGDSDSDLLLDGSGRGQTLYIHGRPWPKLTYWLTNDIKFSIMGIRGLILKTKRKILFAALNHSLPILIPYTSFLLAKHYYRNDNFRVSKQQRSEARLCGSRIHILYSLHCLLTWQWFSLVNFKKFTLNYFSNY